MNVWIGAALLSLLAIGFVLAPWLWRRHSHGSDRRAANIAIARARLAELENDFRTAVLDEADYRQLKLEQERRLLQDVDNATQAASRHRGGALLIAFAVAIPICAGAFYFHYGSWLDWRIQSLLKQSEEQGRTGADNRATVETLRKALIQRLDQRDDDDGRRRFMLAQINIEFGRYSEAVEQYAQLQKKFPQDAGITAQYAQSMYLAANNKMSPTIHELAQRALQIDPNQSTALGLLGLAAFEQKDYAQALLHWRHLLRQLPPASANAAMIQAGISQAEQGLGSAGFPGPKVVVSVSLAPELKPPAGGTLFVFARAVNGPAMPLAVARLDPAKLPLEVTLDDSMAMAAGLNLSSARQVQVFARITASGQVRGEPGDLEGNSPPLDLTDSAQKLSLSIDRKL